MAKRSPTPAALWRDLRESADQSVWGAPPFAPDFRESGSETLQIVAQDGPFRYALLHREDVTQFKYLGEWKPGILSIQLPQWPSEADAAALRERLRLLGLPAFFAAGLSPFDLALYFALRSQSPSFTRPWQDTWKLTLLVVDDAQLKQQSLAADGRSTFSWPVGRSQLPLEHRCWQFLKHTYRSELESLLGENSFRLLDGGFALDLSKLGASSPGGWLKRFAQAATRSAPKKRSGGAPKRKPDPQLASEWRRVRSEVEEYYPELAARTVWQIPARARQLLLVDKDALARWLSALNLPCAIIQVPYSCASKETCALLAAESQRLGAELLYLGDLDPCSLMLFANLRAMDPDRPDARSRALPVRWFGVDDAWLGKFPARGRWTLDRASISLHRDEKRELEFFERRCGSVAELAGPRAHSLLASGRKLEVEALSLLGRPKMAAEVRRRLREVRTAHPRQSDASPPARSPD